MARRFDFPVFDADNHFYETQDAFTRYLPKDYQGAIQYVEISGRTKIAIRGLISDYIPNPTFEVVARPGAQEEYFRRGNPEGKSYRELIGQPIRSPEAFRSPAARLELLDEQGVDQTLMFPTLASLLEERMRDDPELTHVVVHALNQWIDEVWSFNYQNRIFATPVITLPIVEKAIEELHWVLERGARCILVRPAPVPGFKGSRSFAAEEFDPFWREVERSGVLVGMHSSDSGYTRYTSDWLGPQEMLPFRPDAFRFVAEHFRATEDSATAFVCSGTFAKFPELKVAFIENGAAWLKPLIHRLEDAWKKMPHAFLENPIEALQRNVHISPFHEDNFAEIIEVLGVDRLLFGSDYPHPEGLAEPTSMVDHLPQDLSQEDLAKIMGGNLGRLMNVSVPA